MHRYMYICKRIYYLKRYLKSQLNAVAFNRDRISLLAKFLLVLEIKMYLLNDTQQPQQLLEMQIPACIYLLQVCSSSTQGLYLAHHGCDVTTFVPIGMHAL